MYTIVLNLFNGSRHQMYIVVFNLLSGSIHQTYIYMFNLFSGSRHQMYMVGLSDVRCTFVIACSVVLDVRCTFLFSIVHCFNAQDVCIELVQRL
jgi:hypothetical protein